MLKWDVHIVGVVHKPNCSGMNYILSSGEISNLPYARNKQNEFVQELIPPDAVIKRVKVWGGKDACLWGLQFFDTHNKSILKAGYTSEAAQSEFTLQKGERLLGVVSTIHKGYEPNQLDV
jgi:hypothetical protein